MRALIEDYEQTISRLREEVSQMNIQVRRSWEERRREAKRGEGRGRRRWERVEERRAEREGLVYRAYRCSVVRGVV